MPNNLLHITRQELSVLLFAGHVSHQVVDELLHLLDVLGQLSLVLETLRVVRHLEDEAAGGVVVLGGVPHLHGVLQVQSLGGLLKLLPAV